MKDTIQTEESAKENRGVAVEREGVRAKKKKDNGARLGRHSLKSDIPFYLLLLPAIVIVFLFKYLPMSGLLLAFKDWNAKLGLFASPWTDHGGFGNFIRLFQTPELVDAIWNTLYFNVVTMLVEFPAPIILALLLTEITNKPFKRVTQTISYLPHFLSMAAVTGIVNSLLSEYGLINSLLYTLSGTWKGRGFWKRTPRFCRRMSSRAYGRASAGDPSSIWRRSAVWDRRCTRRRKSTARIASNR